MTIFYKNFLKLCASKKISPSSAANQIGLSRAAASGWKNGAIPSDTTIFQLASLFNVPASFFKDGEELKQAENPAVIADNEVDAVTMELLYIINNGSDADRQDMLDMLRIFNKRREKR